MHLLAELWWRLVQFGFYLLYQPFAFSYDLVSWIVSLGAWRCWQRSVLQYLGSDKEVRVLELAHGTGNLHIDLHQAGYMVWGCDLSPQMGRITWAKFKRIGLEAYLARAEAQHLPYPAGRFDVVISTFPTEFIVTAQSLIEVNRVLKPGGLLLVVPGALFTGGGIAASLLEWLYRITGQRPRGSSDEAMAGFSAHIATFGFDVTQHKHECRFSVAQVIKATKKV